MLALGAVRALALCELPVAVFAALAFGVLALAVHDARGAGGGGRLTLDGAGLWHVRGFGRTPFTGRLSQAGYRGAGVVVLVLERDGDGSGRSARARRHVVVFADAIEPDGFSFLHLQLACPDEAR